MTSQCRVTIFRDSRRALIEDKISGLFLKSRNKESAAPIIYHLPISGRLLVLYYGVTHNASVAALAFDVGCVKNDCCADNSDFSCFTFLYVSSNFILLLMNSSKVPLNISFCQNKDGRLADQTNALLI